MKFKRVLKVKKKKNILNAGNILIKIISEIWFQ